MDGRRGLGVGRLQSSPDGSDVQLTWRTTDLYWWGKETSGRRRGPESKGLGSMKQWPTLPSLLRTVPILKPSPMSWETPPPQANWDCRLPYIPQVLSKDKGSQMTISVHGKWICLPNFSLYNPLKPHGSYIETRNAIPFEVYHNKCISLVSQPAFPLLCTVVQGITIVHKASSTHLALWIHSTALLFEKRHAERSFFFFFFLLPFTKKFPMPEDYQGSLKHPMVLIPIKLWAMWDKSELTQINV